MRIAVEAIVIVSGALAIFKYIYSGWLSLKRKERQASLRERREEEAWLNDQLRKEDN